MPSTRKIIRAFLASPGDLEEERQAIRGVVSEFNDSWASELGYQVELIGWEETVAGYGRPQHLINQDLDRCDLFLGMIWKRWGTPPDHSGKFSSGFEEEFERSMARCKQTGSPEVSLFFKHIPEEFRVDPGNDLKKVLEFRETIIAGKKILFQNFSTLQDIEVLARKCITAYVNHVRAEEESLESNDLGAKQAPSDSKNTEEDDKGSESSPLSAKGFEFLEDLVQRIRQPNSLDTLSASDVARFRLLANSISKSGNDETNVGVHDINILFTARTKGTELGNREVRSLTHFGFKHLANENVPLWCWYSDLADSQINIAVVSSCMGDNEDEKVGAISVLTALALDLPTDNALVKRDWVVSSWFSDESPVTVRTAALGYLAKCGTAGDLDIARKEYDRSDHGTSRSALECIIEIHLRTGQVKAAQKLILESQFETLNADLLESALARLDSLESPVLFLGIEHRNPQVRLSTIKSLQSQGVMDIKTAGRLTEDGDIQVRSEAISVLLELGEPLAEEEIKKILVKPQKQTGLLRLGLSASADTDQAGEKQFQQYRLNVFKALSDAELKKRAQASLMHDDAAYFALMEKYFRGNADDLRYDIDNRFASYYKEKIRRVEDMWGDSPAAMDYRKQVNSLEEFVRKKLTRQGLDILCGAQKSEDLQRIRTNLQDGYAGASTLDAKFLGKYGGGQTYPC